MMNRCLVFSFLLLLVWSSSCVCVCVCVSAPTQVSSEFNRVVWYRAQVQVVHQLPACTNTDYRVVCQICTMRSAEYNTMSSTIPSC